MDLGQELLDTQPGPRSSDGVSLVEPGELAVLPRLSTPVLDDDLDVVHEPESRFARYRYAIGVYAASRVALFAIALVCAALFPSLQKGPNSLANELANWDGWWYVHAMTLGWPTEVLHTQTTLGFLPLYPVVGWLAAHLLFCSYVIAGFLVSMVGGLIATLIVQHLATDWWGPQVARKAVLAFVLFPGSVVFSMVYSEGLLIPLVAGCMLALSRRRWLLAGVLAAFATAVNLDALCVVPMCAAAAYVEIRRHGWHDPDARDSLSAVVLAPLGAVATAGFFWLWTGSPFANFIAQRDGWNEHTSPFAIPHQIAMLLSEIGFHFTFWHVNLNVVVGLVGVVFLFYAGRALWRDRAQIPLPVLVFVACMALLLVTSWGVPPNPRMLITAFPLVIVAARYLEGRAWSRYLWLTGAAFVVLSALTYTGGLLRP